MRDFPTIAGRLTPMHMPDARLPKQLLYAKISSGKRKTGEDNGNTTNTN